LDGIAVLSPTKEYNLSAVVQAVLSGIHSTQFGKYGEWIRVALVLPFVFLCYHFEWTGWRTQVCSAFVALSHVLSLPVFGISYDSFFCQGKTYRFVIACTGVDAYFGSIPLLWMATKSVRRNLLFFGAYFAALSALNLARLAFGLWIFILGVPWWLSHDAFAGACYFVLFLWIAHRRDWRFVRAGY
jgi:exosortase/archaeosortase family protein